MVSNRVMMEGACALEESRCTPNDQSEHQGEHPAALQGEQHHHQVCN